MCGIAGFLNRSTDSSESRLLEIARGMSAALTHRGPDDEGQWADPACGIALGFRRLSIIDVSPTGHQPMVSASGRFVVIFNGEIYNYEDLRAELVRNFAVRLRGTSDTEVMLHGFDAWGFEPTLRRLNGMFAMAVWDREQRALYLTRDRLGEKPVYYGWLGGTFLFVSELKSFFAHPAFQAEINEESIPLYVRYGYVPAPLSIYKHVLKLPPATFLKVTSGDGAGAPQSYWSLHDVVERAAESRFDGSLDEAVDSLTARLQRSIQQRMQSDVPLGAFLSGGIDSSTVVALMQTVSAQPVHSFSIGFKEDSHDEAKHAARVAKHLGTKHQEFYVSCQEALDVIPRLPELFDEPFADSSQIPTFLISQLAKQYVTVALTGDGGDEVFGGYNRYIWLGRVWSSISRVPRRTRPALGGALTLLSPNAWNSLFRAFGPILPQSAKHRSTGQKLHKIAQVLRAENERELYHRISSIVPFPSDLLDGNDFPIAESRLEVPSGLQVAEQMMYLDTLTYLPDDILTKVDRASMGASLETRAPFVDHEIVEFAWQLPLAWKIKDGKGKYIIRKVLEKILPPALTERPKAGFEIPLGDWLRRELRDYVEATLDERSLRQHGYFDVAAVRAKWREHLSGRRDWQFQLWNVLMLQAWLTRQTSAFRSTASV
jgi:asparagine synthase (glutamine-hydrolysing)